MQALKFRNFYTLISHQFRKPFKVNCFGCNRCFISQNGISQDSNPLKLYPFKHSYHEGSQYLTLKRDFRVKSCFFKEKNKDDADVADEPEKLSLVKRYKKMLKEYWYILIPVHLATSTLWFGLFYYVAKSGFDIIPFLEMISIPEKIIQPLRNSSLGYIAVASALYKLATPARYMVTLGGTTVAIKQLTKRGLIKPVPSRAKFKTMIQSKLQTSKDNVKSKDS